MQEKTYRFHVLGMHCKACVLMTESELEDLSQVSRAKSSLESNTVEVTGDFGGKSESEVAEELTIVLAQKGYSLSTERSVRTNAASEFMTAVPIALAFIIGFLFLQKAGLVNLVGGGRVTYGTAFVVGIIASLSTCMAVVGGLVLSMSATFAKEGDRFRPQALFHLGRIVSFFVFGGVIGALGTVFQISGGASLVISLVVAAVMLILGVNLLDVFPWAKKLQPAMPKFLARHALGAAKANHTLTPLVVGVATFFLPCGFTQSMQIYTLTTGTFLKGGLTMLSFALGTLPVLALVSFSSSGVQNSPRAGIFFKSAGLIVIVFAIFNFMNALTAAGRVSVPSVQAPVADNVSLVSGKQVVEIRVKGGYTPQTSEARAAINTTLRFETSGTFDCSSSIVIPSLNIRQTLPATGSTDIEIPAQRAGTTLNGSCAMGMYHFAVVFK